MSSQFSADRPSHVSNSGRAAMAILVWKGDRKLVSFDVVILTVKYDPILLSQALFRE